MAISSAPCLTVIVQTYRRRRLPPVRWPVGGKDKLVGGLWSRERAAFVYCGEHPQDGAWCRARPLGSFSQAMLFCSSRPITSKHFKARPLPRPCAISLEPLCDGTQRRTRTNGPARGPSLLSLTHSKHARRAHLESFHASASVA